MLLLRFRGISRKEITYIKNSLCASLAASRPQGNGAGEYQQTEQKRREIADAGKEGRRQLMRHKTIDIPCLLMRYGVEKLTVRADDCRYAGRGRTQDWNAFLQRAQAGLRQMLWWSPASDRKSTRLNSRHSCASRMPSSA